MSAPKALNAAQLIEFQRALALLKSGQKTEALAAARALANQATQVGDAYQLLGMCSDEAGFPEQAAAAFERALQLLPGNAMVQRNAGIFFARYGKQLRNQAQLKVAERILQRAVQLAPHQAVAWVDLGAVQRQLGCIDEALAAFQQAQALGIQAPELHNAINGTLHDAGRLDEAVAGARLLVNKHPDFAPAYASLTDLLWENAAALLPGEHALTALAHATHAQPENRDLQLQYISKLLSAKQTEEALQQISRLRHVAPDDPVLAWFAADAHDTLMQHAQATLLFERAWQRLNTHGEFLNAYTRHAFRRKQIELAHDVALRAVRLDASNQEAWSHLGTAWRLLGDEREHWLFDYERLVGVVDVPPPPGYSDMAVFLVELAEHLEAMHLAQHAPMNQSVRGGTQTPGRLFGRKDALIQSAEIALRSAIEAWLARLPNDAQHPFLSRKRHSVHIVGSWSVRLQSAGRHSNHIHNEGWMSSAFYVALPDAVRRAGADTQAGWIQFGAPLEDLQLSLPPRRVVQPQPGRLALFPSYTWHGTVPFIDASPRLTIAFDMQPE